MIVLWKPALVGFAIAVAIGLTGVGGGILTAPLLIVLFGVCASDAVGTALTFGAIAKLVVALSNSAGLLPRQSTMMSIMAPISSRLLNANALAS
jgi:uncharacterized membrane protein YfcA